MNSQTVLADVSLFETLPIPLILLDAALRAQAANAEFYRQVEIAPEALENRLIFEALAAEDAPSMLEARLRQVLAGGQEADDLELHLRLSDGPARVFLVKARRLPAHNAHDDAARLLLALQEITPQRQMEKTLRFQDQLLNAVGQAVIATDPEGNIIYWNRFAEILYGWKAREVIGHDALKVIPAKATRRQGEEIMALLRTGASWSGEFLVRRRDGTEFPAMVLDTPVLDENRRLVGIIGVSHDVSERIRVQNALRESEERFRKVFTEGPMGMALLDKSFKFIALNPALCNMLGYAEEELVGQSLLDITYPEDVAASLWKLYQLMIGEIPNYHIEKRYVTKHDKAIWIDLTTTVLRNDRGEPLYGLSIVQNITERKEAEEKIRDYAARTEALAKMTQALAEVSLDHQAVLEKIAQQVAHMIGDVCVIRLSRDSIHHEKTPWLRPVAYYHPDPEALSIVRSILEALPADHDGASEMIQQVLRTGQPLLLNNLTSEQIKRSIVPEYEDTFMQRFGIEGVLIVPLRVHGKVFGTIGLTRDRGRPPYTEADQTFLTALADRAALAIHNSQLFEQVQRGHQRMTHLAQQVVTAQEDERQRLSRELHDEAGQALTALKISLQLIRDDLPENLVATRQEMNETIGLADTLMEHIRQLSRDLRPPALDTMGLSTTLESYCHEFSRRTHLPVHFEQETALPAVSDVGEVYLYRLLQEALTNAAKHAQASQVWVRLSSDETCIQLSVEDDGCGFDPGSIVSQSQPSDGIGLIGMQERLELLNGWLKIDSKPAAGTRLLALIPRQDRS